MRILIDSDDAGASLKNTIIDHLNSKSIDVLDLDFARGSNKVNYPEIGYNLALRLRDENLDRGILICGTGLGMAMIANKVKGVYAGPCHDVYSAERLRKSNNAQIITMGARVIGSELAKKIIDAWLESEFEGGKSTPKVEMMHILEERSFGQTKER